MAQGRSDSGHWRRRYLRFPWLTWYDEHGDFGLRLLMPGWYLVRKSHRRRALIYRPVGRQDYR